MKELSPAQERIAHLYTRGYSVPQIAKQFGNSPKTIESHMRIVYAKLGFHAEMPYSATSSRGRVLAAYTVLCEQGQDVAAEAFLAEAVEREVAGCV